MKRTTKKSATKTATARKGKTVKGKGKTEAVKKVIAAKDAKAVKATPKAVKATKAAKAAPKGKATAKTAKVAALPTVCYGANDIMQAGMRHVRNKGAVEDLKTTEKSDHIKKGDIIRGAHGFRVASQGIPGVKSSYGPVKFKATDKVTKGNKEYPAMILGEDVLSRTAKSGCFAVYMDGKTAKNCLIRAEGWVAKKRLSHEIVAVTG